MASEIKIGDVFQVGKHRVMCGDSANPEHVEKLMDGKKAQLLHADPPYGMNKGFSNDNLKGDKLLEFNNAWWQAYQGFLASNASAYIWGRSFDLWRLLFEKLMPVDEATFKNEVVWAKANPNGMRSLTNKYVAGGERCLFIHKNAWEKQIDYKNHWASIRNYLKREIKKAGLTYSSVIELTGTYNIRHWTGMTQFSFISEKDYTLLRNHSNDDCFLVPYARLKKIYRFLKKRLEDKQPFFDNRHEAMSDVWRFKQVLGDKRLGHDTPKPVDMIERAVKSSCPDGGLVVEPFGGTGSTLMACENTNRTCYTMELSPYWVSVILKRYNDSHV